MDAGFRVGHLYALLRRSPAVNHLRISSSNWHVLEAAQHSKNLRSITINDITRHELDVHNTRATKHDESGGLLSLQLKAETQDCLKKS